MIKSLAALAALSLTVAGCAGGSNAKGEKNEAPEGLETFYNQDVEWKECGEAECAEVDVPLDYAKPSDETIKISMLKVSARSGDPIGTLFVNPGGPGGSGKDLAKSASEQFGAKVLDSYDIVGFDPRGVGDSTPIDCLSDERLGKLTDLSPNLNTPEGKELEDAKAQEIVQGCSMNSKELIKHVDTVSVARDLDILRALSGDEKLNYIGLSYGTQLGGQYAELFPDKVGRLVLDGAVDTSLGLARMSFDQTLAFEVAIQHYLESCISQGNCPLGSTVEEGQQKMREILDQAQVQPIPTGNPDRPLTRSMLVNLIVGTLYGDDRWPLLTIAFDEIVNKNTAERALLIGDELQSRDGDKFTDNSTEANWAINCADFPPSSPEEFARYTKELNENAKVLGAFQTEGADVCAQWPHHPTAKPGPFVAKGSAPIVVIGTLYDPATPYPWAEALHKSLDNSVLVTWEGEGHIAYGRAGSCITDAVDSYLVDGVVPQDGLRCPAKEKAA